MQDCPTCGAFLDVGESPAELILEDGPGEAEPLSEEELVTLLDWLIRTDDLAPPGDEELARLAHTLPDCDWEPAAQWARRKGWPGAELARRLRSGELGRDPEYRAWVAETFEGDAE